MLLTGSLASMTTATPPPAFVTLTAVGAIVAAHYHRRPRTKLTVDEADTRPRTDAAALLPACRQQSQRASVAAWRVCLATHPGLDSDPAEHGHKMLLGRPNMMTKSRTALSSGLQTKRFLHTAYGCSVERKFV
jgi:hypothetical protein